jgi:hypothetical protein
VTAPPKQYVVAGNALINAWHGWLQQKLHTMLAALGMWHISNMATASMPWLSTMEICLRLQQATVSQGFKGV